MAEFTVDFIAKEPDDSIWRMVLVEQGAWPTREVEHNLRRVQERLYRCIDVALDGGLWRLYPDSYGKPVSCSSIATIFLSAKSMSSLLAFPLAQCPRQTMRLL